LDGPVKLIEILINFRKIEFINPRKPKQIFLFLYFFD
jgi:hypothetical protein